MMLIPSVLTAALALLPSTAFAVNKSASELTSYNPDTLPYNGTMNFCIGAKNDNGACKSTDDYLADLNALANYTDSVRTYATSDCNTLENLLPALSQASHNFSAYIGVWPTDDAHFGQEKQALSQFLPKYGVNNIKGITVGSEVLYRNDLSASALADRINDVRGLVKSFGFDVPVGTADSWNLWAAGAGDASIQASDFIMSNDFPYWQGQNTSNMTNTFISDTLTALDRVQHVKGTNNVQFLVGETGWPTGGPSYGEADTSNDIAKQFYHEALCQILKKGIDVYYFEAFDESYKGTDSNVEPHFGAFYSNRVPKFSLNCTQAS
ncbi:glucan 1,3-beta-glucosidase Bgl2 [Schizosaccharomyces cryophilus OY26]|uniref:glucan 1,3-beta-glucosidase n=1 Tax=Schizosaccharomyces cryophilus (strain OY26 / ATCC MYA-4695 / CBS 11777 / NBRC 106824 / NRRL Y48691) TaxID=653667 RepID=S9XC87_SCHCR|nr:glucan 1,3-beta-glucosidase Bgl2 [Schizosaccharomyces cryophilus OY26]EPY51431.1 glucan 1,3-beta-glucosidase Bgl2 [Schizosaccharomyces cryophilus OY26]